MEFRKCSLLFKKIQIMYLYISMSKNIWLSRQFNQMYFNSIYMLLGHIYQVELIQIQTILKGYLRVGKRRKVNLVWVLFIFHHFFPFFFNPLQLKWPWQKASLSSSILSICWLTQISRTPLHPLQTFNSASCLSSSNTFFKLQFQKRRFQ